MIADRQQQPDRPGIWQAVAKNFKNILGRLEALERANAEARAEREARASRAIAATRVDAHSRLVVTFSDGSRDVVGQMPRGQQ